MNQQQLFSEPEGDGNSAAAARHSPLAERMRPRDIDELIGQEEVVGPGTPLKATASAR
jgi:putative ATPase